MNPCLLLYIPFLFSACLIGQYLTYPHDLGPPDHLLSRMSKFLKTLSGWWFQPLSKIWKSVGIISPNIWKNKTCSKLPHRLWCFSPQKFRCPILEVFKVMGGSPRIIHLIFGLSILNHPFLLAVLPHLWKPPSIDISHYFPRIYAYHILCMVISCSPSNGFTVFKPGHSPVVVLSSLALPGSPRIQGVQLRSPKDGQHQLIMQRTNSCGQGYPKGSKGPGLRGILDI